jgi:hypothetical protein
MTVKEAKDVRIVAGERGVMLCMSVKMLLANLVGFEKEGKQWD